VVFLSEGGLAVLDWKDWMDVMQAGKEGGNKEKEG
jgi:hypothetical protein